MSSASCLSCCAWARAAANSQEPKTWCGRVSGEPVAEHRQPADGLGLGRLVLRHVPVLRRGLPRLRCRRCQRATARRQESAIAGEGPLCGLSAGRCGSSTAKLLRCMSPEMCRFSDAGMRRLSTRCGGRRPKSANARSRGSVAPGSAASAIGTVCWWRSRWRARREQIFHNFRVGHERCTSGFLMFLARVISNGCAWQKQHIPQPLRD